MAWMPTYEPDLAGMKQRFIDAPDFGDLMQSFVDDFANDPRFLKLGSSVRDPKLEVVLGELAGQVANGVKTLDQVMLFRLPQYKFSHGAFFFGSWVGTFFYFEDIDRGLVALGDDSGPTHFARFTLVPLPGKHHSDLN